jgi:hypothetical protein
MLSLWRKDVRPKMALANLNSPHPAPRYRHPRHVLPWALCSLLAL